jgi:nucleotide-binding universal stress UspA family protein
MYERMLVAIDGSTTSDRALAEAIRLAKLTGARLRLLHVIDVEAFGGAARGYVDPHGAMFAALRRFADEVLAERQARAAAEGVGVETEVIDDEAGHVGEGIVADAERWGADLVVLGSHGRRGVRRLLLGSTAERVARLASVPVLLVRERAA